MFLGKTSYSYIRSLHLGVNMGTGEVNARGSPAIDLHSFQGGVKILLVALCYRNWDKHRRDWPVSSYAGFTYLTN